MKKPLSNMTPDRFTDYQTLLGLSGTELARTLQRAPATISQYRSGDRPIPLDVHKQLIELGRARMQHVGRNVKDLEAEFEACVGAAVVYHNTVEKPNKPRPITFYNRVRKPEQRDKEERLVLGPYRITTERYPLLIKGLANLHKHLKSAVLDRPAHTGLRVALADLKSVAEQVRGLHKLNPPFTMCPTYAEWRVISAALRSDPTDNNMRAFYQHWRFHKGSGWPIYRRG